jgi:hypothetical protein
VKKSTYLVEECEIFTCLTRKYTMRWWHTHTTYAAHYHVYQYTDKNLFEFLKYNNICSLTAILKEYIFKLRGLSTKYAQIWGTMKITPCHIHSSTEEKSARGLNEWRFTNQNTLNKIVPKKNSFCMEINRVFPTF